MTKPILWNKSAHKKLASFPKDVQDEINFALYQAKKGGKSNKAKPLKGFNGAKVLEIVERNANETYRAVYTVEFKEAIVVVHVFQKKSHHGIATPKKEIDSIKRRLKQLPEEYKKWQLKQRKP